MGTFAGQVATRALADYYRAMHKRSFFALVAAGKQKLN